eukprot:TRINITY_DN80876_c0_g1_i1.p1 TRINITY_DN80876_c0_g1~~TRINITY_DN80876_c0_g1_i1.p1  ORF type:complete len:452 (-),score=47.93 TRINITY_DN80876_c0_g1_i1:7-1341(-)
MASTSLLCATELGVIFSFLPTSDLLHVRAVCQHWADAVNAPEFAFLTHVPALLKALHSEPGRINRIQQTARFFVLSGGVRHFLYFSTLFVVLEDGGVGVSPSGLRVNIDTLIILLTEDCQRAVQERLLPVPLTVDHSGCVTITGLGSVSYALLDVLVSSLGRRGLRDGFISLDPAQPHSQWLQNTPDPETLRAILSVNGRRAFEDKIIVPERLTAQGYEADDGTHVSGATLEVLISPAGRQALTDHIVTMWDADRGGVTDEAGEFIGPETLKVLLSPDGRRALTGGLLLRTHHGLLIADTTVSPPSTLLPETLQLLVTPSGIEALRRGIISLSRTRNGFIAALDGNAIYTTTLEILLSANGRAALSAGCISTARAACGCIAVADGSPLFPETLRVLVSEFGRRAVLDGRLRLDKAIGGCVVDNEGNMIDAVRLEQRLRRWAREL